MATKQAEILSILKGLEMGDLEGVALISRDGLLIADNLPRAFDRETFSAMSATMVAAAESAALELRGGAPARVIVETRERRLLAVAASSETLLVALASATANLAGLMAELERAAERVRAVVGN